MSAATAAADSLRPLRPVSLGQMRIEDCLEQLHHGKRRAGVAVDDRLDMRLAVRKTRLPQVLCVRANDDDLLPGQPGTKDEFVEPVDLHPPVPDRGDGVGEPFGDVLRCGRRDRGVRRDPEVVEPHRQPVRTGDGERPLIEDDHSHALQHRQELTQRGRAPAEVPLQLRVTTVVPVFEDQLDRIILQLFDDADVGDRVHWRDSLLVHLW